jgi:hypothetical protein
MWASAPTVGPYSVTVGAVINRPQRSIIRVRRYHGKTGRVFVGTPLLRRPEGRRFDISKNVGKTNVNLRGFVGGWYRKTKVVVSDASERRPYGHDRWGFETWDVAGDQ